LVRPDGVGPVEKPPGRFNPPGNRSDPPMAGPWWSRRRASESPDSFISQAGLGSISALTIYLDMADITRIKAYISLV
jgi:hypothetical protein